MKHLQPSDSNSQSKKKFSFSIQTLGCKANVSDTELLALRLRSVGGVRVKDRPEVFILNSCTVTDKADREALAVLKRNQSPLRVLTGCLAEVNPQVLRDLDRNSDSALEPQQTLLARNSGKGKIPSLILSSLQRRSDDGSPEAAHVTQGDRRAWHRTVDFQALAFGEERTRPFLKVQDGCNQFCAYCIIPRARGRSRSLTISQVVQEINALVATGVNEVVLTAIHMGDYRDGDRSYEDLIRAVLEQTNLRRLRLTSLDPAQITSSLIDLMAHNSRLCPHFHVSLQSASDPILQGMKRQYNVALAEQCLHEIKEKVPHAFVGMDMIGGFPGECQSDHGQTMAFLKRTPWTRLHVFPYSRRSTTAAAKLIDEGLGVLDPEKRSRVQELGALSTARLASQMEAKMGRLVEVLVEKKPLHHEGITYRQGLTRSYFRCVLEGSGKSNECVPVQVVGILRPGVLLAKPI